MPERQLNPPVRDYSKNEAQARVTRTAETQQADETRAKAKQITQTHRVTVNDSQAPIKALRARVAQHTVPERQLKTPSGTYKGATRESCPTYHARATAQNPCKELRQGDETHAEVTQIAETHPCDCRRQPYMPVKALDMSSHFSHDARVTALCSCKELWHCEK
ncbi:hypothetical protein BDR07DRAFT_1386115 [Suillus spraguei]|nr:hypothetical protein BDR07DRAFT_1386115 [Suillus spraguei]